MTKVSLLLDSPRYPWSEYILRYEKYRVSQENVKVSRFDGHVDGRTRIYYRIEREKENFDSIYNFFRGEASRESMLNWP